MSKKQEEGLKMSLFFYYLWHTREMKCSCCGRKAYGDPVSTWFDHLLEKSKYPEIKYLEDNIYVVCPDHHSLKTNGFPLDPHREAIKEFETKYFDNKEFYIEKARIFEEEILNNLLEKYVETTKES